MLAAPITDPDEIKQRLVEQVTGTVRWRECVAYMAANGVTDVYEIGAGKVLAGLAKRIDAALNATSIGTPADIDAALAASQQLEDTSMFDLTGKTALVTGATGGIGGAIARALHSAGRDGRHLRPPGRQARGAGQPSSATACTCCPAISPTRARSPS